MKKCRFCNKTFDRTDIGLKHEFICQDENKFNLKKVNFNNFTGEFKFDNILALKEGNSIKLDEYDYVFDNYANVNIENDCLEKIVTSDNLNYSIYTTDFSKDYEKECCIKLLTCDNKNKKIQIEKLEQCVKRNNMLLKEIAN